MPEQSEDSENTAEGKNIFQGNILETLGKYFRKYLEENSSGSALFTVLLLCSYGFFTGDSRNCEEMPVGATISQITAVFDRLTSSMIEDAQAQAQTIIQKTQSELTEKLLKL